MHIGQYTLTPIVADTFGLDGGAMFGIVPKPLWEKQNPADDQNRINLSARTLLVEGEGRKILIDTGNGDKWEQKYRDIYKISPQNGGLRNSLEDHGVAAGDITDVILTHLHFDHAGGATILKNDDIIPAFPNATYYVQEQNWEWATDPTEKDAGSYRRENFIPLRKHGVLELVAGEVELFPGIQLLTVFGHTQGQQLPLIYGDDTALLYCADLFPTQSHIKIPWVMAYDNFPLTTIKEKKQILWRAAEEDWTLFFEHDPEVESTCIERTDKGFQPVRE